MKPITVPPSKYLSSYPGDTAQVNRADLIERDEFIRTHQPAEPVALTLQNAPIGTKAPAIGGGRWYRVEHGWKWNGPDGSGGVFPRPGGDWDGKLLPPICPRCNNTGTIDYCPECNKFYDPKPTEQSYAEICEAAGVRVEDVAKHLEKPVEGGKDFAEVAAKAIGETLFCTLMEAKGIESVVLPVIQSAISAATAELTKELTKLRALYASQSSTAEEAAKDWEESPGFVSPSEREHFVALVNRTIAKATADLQVKCERLEGELAEANGGIKIFRDELVTRQILTNKISHLEFKLQTAESQITSLQSDKARLMAVTVDHDEWERLKAAEDKDEWSRWKRRIIGLQQDVIAAIGGEDKLREQLTALQSQIAAKGEEKPLAEVIPEIAEAEKRVRQHLKEYPKNIIKSPYFFPDDKYYPGLINQKRFDSDKGILVMAWLASSPSPSRPTGEENPLPLPDSFLLLDENKSYIVDAIGAAKAMRFNGVFDENHALHLQLEAMRKASPSPSWPSGEEVERLKINERNCGPRIENAIATILEYWEQWDAEASADAQSVQDTEAWDRAMSDQLEAILSGLLFDDCRVCGGTGGVDSGGVREDGKSIDVPCPECFPPAAEARTVEGAK